jgi:hypothetical protein
MVIVVGTDGFDGKVLIIAKWMKGKWAALEARSII